MSRKKERKIEMKTNDEYALDAVREEKICEARKRHGKPFAHEAGSEWKPRAVPVLTEWLQSQKREDKK